MVPDLISCRINLEKIFFKLLPIWLFCVLSWSELRSSGTHYTGHSLVSDQVTGVIVLYIIIFGWLSSVYTYRKQNRWHMRFVNLQTSRLYVCGVSKYNGLRSFTFYEPVTTVLFPHPVLPVLDSSYKKFIML